jgi:UPF0755 protein
MRKLLLYILVVIIIILALIGGGVYYVNYLINQPNKQLNNFTIFEVEKGETTREIAAKLSDRKIINSKDAFLIAVRLSNRKLEYGYYQIKPNASIIDIVDTFSSGQSSVEKITIPEGYRAEQIGQLLSSKEVVKYEEFIQKALSLEGKLFPDTYFFSKDMKVDQVIKAMEDNYKARTAKITVDEDTLIIASIVEREAVKDEERPLIAGIYRNRVSRGMKLEADPTVQYGRDNNSIKSLSPQQLLDYKYWKPITLADYHTVQSKFNTYEIIGLPPAPICNPGLKSIEATINYQKHNYLFFLQHDGEIYPSETQAQHDNYRAKILGARI